MRLIIVVSIFIFSQITLANNINLKDSIEIKKHFLELLPEDINRMGDTNDSICTVVFRLNPINNQSPQIDNDFTLSILMSNGKATSFYGNWKNQHHPSGSFLHYNKNFVLYSQSCDTNKKCYSSKNQSSQFPGTFSIYTTKKSSIFSVRNNIDGKLWVCEVEPIASLLN